ncbi:hypothetical protein IJ596_01295 [bacterium]|nr:hypothetical protein [bacterium]
MSTVGAQIVQSALFGTRNSLLGTGIMAPEQNNQVRTLVAFGQAKNALTKLNSVLSNSSTPIKNAPQKVIDLCNRVSENSKVFGKLEKVVDFASKNVNNLICVSSGIKVLTAKDKESEFWAQTGNIAGMFAVEGWMKKNLAKYVDKLPINSKMKPVIEGILFVMGSITGSTICYNIAKKIVAKTKKTNEEYKAQEAQKAMPRNIAVKA